MKILVISQYYYPEDVAAAVWIPQLTKDLAIKGHRVTMLTAFPNYPRRKIFHGYRGKVYQKEWIDGIEVIRTWIYANPNNANWSRLLNWGSFCISSFIGGILEAKRPDVIYAILPPLPLGFFSIILSRIKHSHVVCCIEDIYPLIAVELGILKNHAFINFFSWMERWIYQHTDGLVGLSDGFKQHFIEQGANERKINVIPNWADSSTIFPSSKMTSLRKELNINDNFVVLYSGNLSHNSSVDSLIDAANKLRKYLITFLIVGDGVFKDELVAKAKKENITNVLFLPFQPLTRYPEILASADLTVVTLNISSTLASVPSKIFKQMAAGRPILSITNPGSELDRMVTDHKMGICVSPQDSSAIAEKILWLFNHRKQNDEMGQNGRLALEKYYSRTRCIDLVEKAIMRAV